VLKDGKYERSKYESEEQALAIPVSVFSEPAAKAAGRGSPPGLVIVLDKNKLAP